MTVPVLTAVTDPRWEADIVASLAADHGVEVVRRCVDLADLLAAAAAGLARAVLLSADLRRLDRDALTRLAVAGVAVVGLVAPGDEQAERRLRQLGVAHVLAADAPAADISAALVAAVGHAERRDPLDYADPAAVLADPPAAPASSSSTAGSAWSATRSCPTTPPRRAATARRSPHSRRPTPCSPWLRPTRSGCSASSGRSAN